jgi:hypothetical protein
VLVKKRHQERKVIILNLQLPTKVPSLTQLPAAPHSKVPILKKLTGSYSTIKCTDKLQVRHFYCILIFFFIRCSVAQINMQALQCGSSPHWVILVAHLHSRYFDFRISGGTLSKEWGKSKEKAENLYGPTKVC